MKALAQEPAFCSERPVAERPSLSLGRASRGRLIGALALTSSDAARVLPRRHVQRCLNWGTPRLVHALTRAAEMVRARDPKAPALGIGDLSKASGGPIPPYSRSHQSGRDSDLAFYQVDSAGNPVATDDLTDFDDLGRARRGDLRFDARRNWLLVRALLEDRSIDVKWMFISRPLKAAILSEAAHDDAPGWLKVRAEQVLHQPSDAGPHSDHLHLRIRCTEQERRRGCVD